MISHKVRVFKLPLLGVPHLFSVRGQTFLTSPIRIPGQNFCTTFLLVIVVSCHKFATDKKNQRMQEVLTV
jgi:hypothetical protein